MLKKKFTIFSTGFIRTGPYHDWISEVTELNFDVQVEPTTTTVGIDTTTAEPEPTTVSEAEPTTVSEPEPTTVSEPETEPEVLEAPSKYFFWFRF